MMFILRIYVVTTENFELLHSHVLDFVGCMHIALGIFISNTWEINDFKNHKII